MLENFKRNLPYPGSPDFDQDSFIGLWVDDCVWSDVEYWKLEKDLLSINSIYPSPTLVPREILIGVMKIVQFLMVPNWNNFQILETAELYTLDKNIEEIPNIYDRFERLQYVLSVLYTDIIDIDNIDFDYQLIPIP